MSEPNKCFGQTNLWIYINNKIKKYDYYEKTFFIATIAIGSL